MLPFEDTLLVFIVASSAAVTQTVKVLSYIVQSARFTERGCGMRTATKQGDITKASSVKLYRHFKME